MTAERVYLSTWRPRKYHKSPNCNGLNPTQTAGDKVESVLHRVAVAQGLEPCKTCAPRAALRPVASPKCWCGGTVGPRVPGDSAGVGCLEDIMHDWRPATRTSPPGPAVATEETP